ncbi:MAG: type II toxin-antitoxin system VapB family antitoxin, partial [Pseudonocardiaceae bacterium]
MIFKDVRHGRPYPEHGLSTKDWAQIPPQQVRLEDLVTTTT